MHGALPAWPCHLTICTPRLPLLRSYFLPFFLSSLPFFPFFPACLPACLQFDFNPFLEDDEQKAMQIQENMKCAVANIFPRPFDSQPTAGARACAVGRVRVPVPALC